MTLCSRSILAVMRLKRMTDSTPFNGLEATLQPSRPTWFPKPSRSLAVFMYWGDGDSA